MGVLQDKVAVITGGTRGLGLAIAEAYGAEGAAVMVAARSPQGVDTAIQQLAGRGAQADGLAVDVGQLDDVEALAARAVARWGRIDIWVNNAGAAGPYGPTLDLSPAAFQQVIQTNILGVYHGSWVAMRRFVAQGSGKLINLLGHGYKDPVPYQNAYASSKIWVRWFTETLAEETKGAGVGVFAYNPGMVLTDLLTHGQVIQGSEERLRRFPTVVRLLARPPAAPAQKAVWLASSATDGKTGLLVSFSSPWTMLGGAVREGLRALRRQPAPPIEIHMQAIPPYRDPESAR